LDWSPRALRKKARALESAHHRLHARLGRPASETEVAEELGIGLAELQQLLGDLRRLDLVSLQAEYFEEGREAYAYRPHSTEGQDVFHLCLRAEMKALLAQAIDELPPRERQVVSLYYYKELTMKEAGAVLGVGEARISQLHSSAMVRLRARMQGLQQSRPSRNGSATEVKPVASDSTWKEV
jgi:RNA polymerase sigma factor for flagellar operon FliA